MGLKIVYPICCGIDVHKIFVIACIASTNKGVTTYKRHRFSTYTKGLKELSQCLCENHCQDVCMESTGNNFGKSSMNIINKLLDNPLDPSFDIEPLIHGSPCFLQVENAAFYPERFTVQKAHMKKKLPELELAIDGFITSEQAGKIKVIQNHCLDLESRKAELESIILSLADSYSQELNLILTVPSFRNLFSAITVVSEIGVNMDVFPTANHLCSWTGLTPTNNESAGKKKSIRISKAGCYIKPVKSR